MYPRVLIDLNKFKNNAKVVVERLDNIGISVFGVTKVFCGDLKLVNIFAKMGVAAIADSRIENLKKAQDISIKKVLLRIPMQSQVADVIKYADVSLNSEIETIEILSKEALTQGKKHGIILMVDLGDLREGFFDENDFFSAIEKIAKLDGVEVVGIGTNLTCFGAIIPKLNHMSKLMEIKHKIQSRYSINIDLISAGNSSSYYLIENYNLPSEINNLRIGEIFVCGRETAFGQRVKGTQEDVFVLESEIVELKNKPSVPIGEQGIDAFGNKPSYEDKGVMKRAICALGRQDASIEGLIPFDEKIEIIGSSSDHIILDVTQSDTQYKVGDILKFRLTYGGILSVMTSEYVEKKYV